MIDDDELREEWYQDMEEEARREQAFEYDVRNDIDVLREYLDDLVCEANDLLDTIGKNLEHYGYDSSDEDILEFIRG